ncbi:hypothetical protein C5S53_03650, partial [Methanophagales archaeon]
MLKIILLLLPIILGAVVAIAKPKFVVSWTNKLNDWLMEKKKKFAEKDDSVSTFFIKPLIGGLCLIRAVPQTNHRILLYIKTMTVNRDKSKVHDTPRGNMN